MDTIIQILTDRLKELIAGDPSLFIVEIRIKPTNNIKAYIDGDQGVGIDTLVKLNRAFYRQLEESGMYPDGDFSLELSSPGLDEPLKMHRQYLKNTGRFVEVTGVDGTRVEGKLLSVNETGIVVEETSGKGKKAVTKEHSLSFEQIKTTKIQIKF